MLAAASATAVAQTPDEAQAQRDAARQLINQQRDQENARFDAQVHDCGRQFVVSSCVKEVETRRRAMLAKYRGEEGVLNDQDRKQRAEEQKQRTREKLQERARREQDIAAENLPQKLNDKSAEQARKQAENAAEKARTASQPQKSVRTSSKAGSGPSEAEQAQNRAAYDAKLEDARKRKESQAKRLKEKPSDARPLPVQP